MAWRRVAGEGEVFTARAFEVEGRRVAVFRTPEGIYALDDICSH